MENVLLNAKIRIGSGTSAAKKLRAEGTVPAIMYAKKENPIQMGVDQKELVKLIHKFGENSIITLKVDDKGKENKQSVIIKEIQFDYIRNIITHVDFQSIKMTEKIRVHVPLVTKGDADAPGVKAGGNLEHVLHEIEIESLPASLPKQIIVDVSALDVGDSMHVGDLKVDKDVQIVTNPELVAVLVKYEAEEKTEEEVPSDETSAEPEVIKKGKTEDEKTEG